MKIDKYFKFRNNRDTGSIKLIFFAGELEQKPIKYWSNVGSIHPHSRLKKLVRKIKKMIDYPSANNIHYLSYYSGSRIVFPYHVHWMDDRFEMTVYNTFGDGKGALHLGRKVSSQNERFTDAEIKKIQDFMHREYHIIYGSYYIIKDFVSDIDSKNYYEFSQRIKRIKNVKK